MSIRKTLSKFALYIVVLTIPFTTVYSENSVYNNTEHTGSSVRKGKNQITCDGIIVIGNNEFINKTKEALALIKKSPSHYKLMIENIVAIEQIEGQTVMQMLTKKVLVNNSHAFSDKFYYGSTIVHEANHSKQMQEYCRIHSISYPSNAGFVPLNVYSGEQAEMECVKVQRDFLVKIGASQSHLDWIDSVIETRWWEKGEK